MIKIIIAQSGNTQGSLRPPRDSQQSGLVVAVVVVVFVLLLLFHALATRTSGFKSGTEIDDLVPFVINLHLGANGGNIDLFAGWALYLVRNALNAISRRGVAFARAVIGTWKRFMVHGKSCVNLFNNTKYH